MAGEETVGSIVGFLRLDSSDFDKGIDRALAKEKELGASDPDIHIDVNASETIAQLDAVQAATKDMSDQSVRSSTEATSALTSITRASRQVEGAQGRLRVAEMRLADLRQKGSASATQLASAELGVANARRGLATASESLERENNKVAESNDRISNSADRANRRTRPLIAALLALGPTLIPLGAAAVGVGAAFAGMGAAGVLAVVGIKKEIEDGTALGKRFSIGIDEMKADLQGLAHVAAAGVLSPFQEAVEDLHTRLPGLSDEVRTLSTIAGRTAGSLVSGLVAAFQTLSPLMVGVGVSIAGLADKFDAFGSSNGLRSFGDYVQSVMPQVGAALSSIIDAVGALVRAFAPIGTAVLTALGSLSDIISSLPVGVLTAFGIAAGAAAVGLKGLKVAEKVGDAIQAMTARVAAGKAALSGLSIATAGVSLVLGGLAYLYIRHQESVRKDAQAVDDLTQVLIRNNGELDKATIKQRQQNLIQDGAYETARKYGVGAKMINDVLADRPGALEKVNAKLEQNATHTRIANRAQLEMGTGTKELNGDAKKLSGQLGDLAGQTKKAKDQAQESNRVTRAGLSGARQQITLSTQQQAKKDLLTAATNRQKNATNDLVTAMGEEITKAAILAGGTLALDQAMLNMTETLKKNKGAMSRHTQAGLDDRQAILGVVTSLQQQRDNLIRTGTSSDVATRKYSKQATQLLQNIARTQGADSAAYKYAQQLLKIPKNVKTVITANTDGAVSKIRAVQSAINALHNRNVTITTTHVNAFNRMSAMAGALPSQQADGGFYPHGVRAMADGGNTRQAMVMTRRAPILWNEADGGEAYIPLSPAKRQRSQMILSDVAQRFGQQVVPAAPPAPSQAGQQGPARMHPHDRDALARAIGREVAKRPTVLNGQAISQDVGRQIMAGVRV